MNCDKIKENIDLDLSINPLKLSQEIEDHLNSCDSCKAYYQEAVSLQTILNKQKFDVRAGELDNISLDKIKFGSKQEVNEISNPTKIRPLRWIWAPAAAVAVLLLFVLAPDFISNGDGKIDTYITEITFDNDLDLALTEGYGSEIISGLINDDDDLDELAGEFVYDLEINTLLESLSDDELIMLEEKLNIMNGSTG
jgi:hypothetical protein